MVLSFLKEQFSRANILFPTGKRHWEVGIYIIIIESLSKERTCERLN